MDFKSEALKRKKQIIEDLQGWIQTGGVYDETTAKEGQPFGEDVKASLDYITRLAIRDGFNVKNLDGYCVEISYGEGDEYVGILGHADVVPTGTGWIHKEFGGEIEENLIYGRGSSDDKGPTLTAYYALRILKENNIKLGRQVRIIVGGNEETGSRCMHHYFETLHKEAPTYGFTPDADFPLIYGEKGIMSYEFTGDFSDNIIKYMYAGEASNAVPAECIVIFKNIFKFKEKAIVYAKKHGFEVKFDLINGFDKMTVIGKAAHAAFPEGGVNAAARALEVIEKFTDSNFARYFARKMSDYYGKGLEIDCKSKEMGKLTMNLGIVKYENDKYQLIINIRYPENIKYRTIGATLDTQVLNSGKIISFSEPLYVDPKSKFIQTLMKVYKDVTQDSKAQPITIGGGTYARETKNTVAFGMDFKRNNGSGNIHSQEEAINIEDIIDGMNIYAKAIMELSNL